MEKEPFYSGGLKFSCTRCSACCRFEPGFVFLSRKDAEILAAERGMGYTEFVDTYCRWIPGEGGRERLSLREKASYDCIFWDGGCSVYRARPLQCRSFPFWPSLVASQEAWEEAAASCPGINWGTLHPRDRIEACLAEGRREPALIRNAGLLRGSVL